MALMNDIWAKWEIKYDGMPTSAPYSPPSSPRSIIAVNALLSDIFRVSDNTNST